MLPIQTSSFTYRNTRNQLLYIDLLFISQGFMAPGTQGVGKDFLKKENREAEYQSSRRPSIAFSIVISSAYSMSLPTGIPIAIRVTLSPARRNWPRR
jgi:hypothetical protein